MWQFLTKVNIYLSILNTLSKNWTILLVGGEKRFVRLNNPLCPWLTNSYFLSQGQVTSEQQFQFVPRQPQETQPQRYSDTFPTFIKMTIALFIEKLK